MHQAALVQVVVADAQQDIVHGREPGAALQPPDRFLAIWTFVREPNAGMPGHHGRSGIQGDAIHDRRQKFSNCYRHLALSSQI